MISSWNLNGIRSSLKTPHFKEYIKTNDPDILCLSETRVNEKTLDEVLKNEDFETVTKDYTKFWNFSKVKKGYSGTAIFTK